MKNKNQMPGIVLVIVNLTSLKSNLVTRRSTRERRCIVPGMPVVWSLECHVSLYRFIAIQWATRS